MMFDGLQIPEDYELVSMDEGDPKSDDIFSVSENEEPYDLEQQIGHVRHEFVCMIRESDGTCWMGKEGGYQPLVRVSHIQYHCTHEWEFNKDIGTHDNHPCTFCKIRTLKRARVYCPVCGIVCCNVCSNNYLGFLIPVERTPRVPSIPKPKQDLLQQQAEYIKWADAEIERLKEKLKQSEKRYHDLLEEHLAKEAERQAAKDEQLFQRREGKQEWRPEPKKTRASQGIVIKEGLQPSEEQEEEIIAFWEILAHGNEAAQPKRRNNLYNMEVILLIDGEEEVKLKAILDTGATSCCIDENAVNKRLLEPNT